MNKQRVYSGCYIDNDYRSQKKAEDAALQRQMDGAYKGFAQVFSSNYVLYGDMSARVMATLSHFSPDVEIYSIDEAFVDLSWLSALRQQTDKKQHWTYNSTK